MNTRRLSALRARKHKASYSTHQERKTEKKIIYSTILSLLLHNVFTMLCGCMCNVYESTLHIHIYILKRLAIVFLFERARKCMVHCRCWSLCSIDFFMLPMPSAKRQLWTHMYNIIMEKPFLKTINEKYICHRGFCAKPESTAQAFHTSIE